jgi:hypothetical protein
MLKGKPLSFLCVKNGMMKSFLWRTRLLVSLSCSKCFVPGELSRQLLQASLVK